MSVFRVKLTQGDTRTGSGNLDSVSLLTGSISDATNASPIVVTTSAAHGLVSGAKVAISGVGGNTAANATWTVTVLSTTTFSLTGSTGNAAYTSGGTWVEVSRQRTMYCPGPNKINRKLNDGDVFTDCNYWKRFTYPTLPYNQAFIETLSDDGAVYEDGEQSVYPLVFSKTIAAGSTYTTTGNYINVLDDYGAPALFTQITVSGHAVNVRLNGSTSAVLPIASGTTQIFNAGDLPITKLEFDNSTSGTTTATVVVTISVESKCNS